MLKILIAAVVVGTWNGNWFPSGRAKHRAPRAVEKYRIEKAARVLAEGIARLDPGGTNDVVLCLNEIRGREEAEELIAGIGRKDLKLVTITRYRWRDRFDQQQDAIAATLPVASSGWSVWKKKNGVLPPRGYAFAQLVIEPAVTAGVYAVHLKSNYGQGRDEKKISENRLKRALAVEQIVGMERPRRASARRPVIVAGDLNADRYSRDFALDTIFNTLDEAGFRDAFAAVPPEKRYTRESRRFGRGTIDFIMYRDFADAVDPFTVDIGEVSDHKALFTLLDVKNEALSSKKGDAK